jgi:RNA 2',3'-cyclic 3'-phosphodiesterase
MARIRIFIAVELDQAVRERAAALQEQLARSAADVKWVEPDSMHLTLLFLGEVAELDLVPICRVVAEGAKELPPFQFTISGIGAFPTPRRPKVLWAGVTDGIEALRELHERLEGPLLELGCYRREERAYTPHLTLGRINRGDTAANWGPLFARHSDWEGGTTSVSEVLVMSSELRRDGPVYTVVGRGRLKGVPAEEVE